MKKYSKGFTLIELLVVIAIIGILSSVVLASLNTARNKGNDAAIKSQLANLRAEAEMYYDGVGGDSYGAAQALGNCPTSGTTIFAVDASFKTAIAGTLNGATPQCVAYNGGTGSSTAWAMSANTKSPTASTWCVDSTGASKGSSAATASGTCS